MNDLIYREQTINHLKKRLIETAINNTGFRALCDIIFADIADNRIEPWINEIPSAEKTGMWLDIKPALFHLSYATCSLCGERSAIEEANYCPNCGARMERNEDI